MHTINPYMLIIIGIMFEIMAAFFLISAFYRNRIFQTFIRVSIWSKKKAGNMIIVLIPALIPLIYFVYAEISGIKLNTTVGLSIPIIIALVGYVSILDDSEKFKSLISRKDDKRQIGTYGFMMLLVGNIFQIIGVIWQANLSNIA